MSQLRLNPLTGRWVTVAVERAARPAELISRQLPVESDPARKCPFCPGNEEATPPALETYGPNGRWLVRVVPNLFPAFEGNDPLRVQNLGPVFTQASASGVHEVLVFSPEHTDTWADLDDKHAAPKRKWSDYVQGVAIYLEAKGYRIIDCDVETSLRDPIIHFMNP